MTVEPLVDPVSQAFVTARLAGRSLDGFPGDLPGSLGEAYAIQSRSIEAWPDEVAGWKVGGVPDPFRTEFGTDRLAGPIFSRAVKRSGGGVMPMPVYEGGFAAVEAEFVLVLGDEVSPGALPATVGAAREAVRAVRIGVEIASSPLRVINDLGPTSIISDFGNNAGLLLGPEVENGRGRDLSEIPIEVAFDGAMVGEGRTAREAPFEAAAFLIGLCARRGLALPAGALISTGAVTGVHAAEIGTRSRVRFGDAGSLDLELVAAGPSA